MAESILWEVWGHKKVIKAETSEQAVREYHRMISRPLREEGHADVFGVSIEARAHESSENAETLRRQRDRYKELYEREVRLNKDAREALDKIHETIDVTGIYDRDE